MLFYEYTTVDENTIYHTVDFKTIPKGATIHRSLPIEEFYSEENLIETYFDVFHAGIGSKLESIKIVRLTELRARKNELFNIPYSVRTTANNNELCDITSELGTYANQIEKSHFHVGKGLYVTEDVYRKLISQCRCAIVIGRTSTLTFSDIKMAISNYHELVCTTPNSPIELYLVGQDIGRYRLFQYMPQHLGALGYAV